MKARKRKNYWGRELRKSRIKVRQLRGRHNWAIISTNPLVQMWENELRSIMETRRRDLSTMLYGSAVTR